MNKTISKKKQREQGENASTVWCNNEKLSPWIRGSDYKPRGMGGNSKTHNQPRATNFSNFYVVFRHILRLI